MAGLSLQNVPPRTGDVPHSPVAGLDKNPGGRIQIRVDVDSVKQWRRRDAMKRTATFADCEADVQVERNAHAATPSGVIEEPSIVATNEARRRDSCVVEGAEATGVKDGIWRDAIDLGCPLRELPVADVRSSRLIARAEVDAM